MNRFLPVPGAEGVPKHPKLTLLLGYLPDWIITIVLVLVPALLTKAAGFKREFSLTDTSIQHTHALHERITFQGAIVIAGVVPLVIQLACGALWKRSFWDCHNSTLGFVLSCGITTTITNILKVTVGRPRPDLIDRCQPLAGSINASPYGLVTWEICTVKTGNIIHDGFKSFPSGHSSFSFAGLGFLSFYLAGKLHLFDRRSQATKAWIAFMPLMGAALVAVSRSMDYRHHATDLLAGSILGLSLAYFTYSLYYPPLNNPRCDKPYSPRMPSVRFSAWDADAISKTNAPLRDELDEETAPRPGVEEEVSTRQSSRRAINDGHRGKDFETRSGYSGQYNDVALEVRPSNLQNV